jgi:ribosomal peptide maturation radical SAM protein 1
MASACVPRLADRLAGTYDVVGFTTTFMQNVPSLALAKELKRRQPDLVTIFGGGSCDGSQGAALHRCFPDAVDIVVRGEGERPLVAVLDALLEPEPGRADKFAAISGLCWRNDGQPVVNPIRPMLMQAADIPRPEYGPYFALLQELNIGPQIDPSYVLEGARGCWWGQKSHCRFCGLNGTGMTYRSRPADDVLDEIVHAAEEFGVLDIVTVDNIMDPEYPTSLMPGLADSELDLRLHFEVKSDLNDEELDALADAQVVHIQPGIESLSSHVLKLMRKGATGTQNVRLLRAALERGLTVSWNLLFGFPGEEPTAYAEMIRQFPALVHLPPPDVATRISVQRFSPYFDDPSLGFDEREPARFYSWIYSVPREELEDLVFLFDAAPRGIDEQMAASVIDAVARWQASASSSWLLGCESDGEIVVEGRRHGFGDGPIVLNGDDAAVLRAVQQPTRIPGLLRRLCGAGRETGEGAVRAALARLRDAGLIYEDNGACVSVVPFAQAPAWSLPL